MQTVRGVFRDHPSVEVDTFEGLLVDYAHRRQASVIVRGLRAISDFEAELQMALMNRRLDSDLETVFMMPAEPYTYVSSRLVKEVFATGRVDYRPRARGGRSPAAPQTPNRCRDQRVARLATF